MTLNIHVPGRRRIIVHWSLTRQYLLISWIETHPEERIVLISRGKNLGNSSDRLTKTACAMRAAAVVFAEDEEVGIRKEALDNPTHFGTAVRDVIRHKSVYSYILSCAECRLLSTGCSPLGFDTRWVYAYQTINQEIGCVVANMQYSEIAADSALLKKVGESIFDSTLITG